MPPKTIIPSVGPPPNPFMHRFLPSRSEPPQERAQQKRDAAEAAAINNAIEEKIEQEKVTTAKRYQNSVRIVLLGQSGSGKSTIVKKFNETEARHAHESDVLRRTMIVGWQGITNSRIRMLLRQGVELTVFKLSTAFESLHQNFIKTGSYTKPAAQAHIVQSIVFLAPLDCFNQRLVDGTNLNYLEDCISRWKHICDCHILVNVQPILFFTKVDLMEKKLKSGVPFNKYFVDYGSRPNDVRSVTSFLTERFRKILQNSRGGRAFLHFTTSDTDTLVIRMIMQSVSQGLIENLLKETSLIEGNENI